MRVYVFPPKGLHDVELEERLYDIREAIECNGDEAVVPVEYCPFAEDLSGTEIARVNAAEFDRCEMYYSEDGYVEYAEQLGKHLYFILI